MQQLATCNCFYCVPVCCRCFSCLIPKDLTTFNLRATVIPFFVICCSALAVVTVTKLFLFMGTGLPNKQCSSLTQICQLSYSTLCCHVLSPLCDSISRWAMASLLVAPHSCLPVRYVCPVGICIGFCTFPSWKWAP